MNVFHLAAVVVFVVTAILAFFFSVDVPTLIGLVAGGLALYAASSFTALRVG